jgi:hypothetical protein
MGCGEQLLDEVAPTILFCEPVDIVVGINSSGDAEVGP